MIKKATAVAAQQTKELIEEVGRRHPHSMNILRAFEPLLAAKSRVMAETRLRETGTNGIDAARFASGVPLLQLAPFFLRDDPWRQMALPLLDALRRGLPAIAGAAVSLQRSIESGAIDLADYFCADENRRQQVVAAWEQSAGFSLPVWCLLIETLRRVVLEKRRTELSAFIQKTAWERGYCPMCGDLPGLSIIHEKIPDRWLHCTGCGHEWRFSRALCPCCGQAAKEDGMSYFFVEGKDTEAAFVCDGCKKYLATLNRIDNPGEKDVEILAIGMAHLDVMMQDRGYSPMKSCFWNRLQ